MIKQYKIPFHYRHTVHQDIILKINCNNIMEVPRWTKTICVIKNKSLSLALEMVYGQKLKLKKKVLAGSLSLKNKMRGGAPSNSKTNKASTLRNSGVNQQNVPQNAAEPESFLMTMRNDIMYDCVDKLLATPTQTWSSSVHDCVFKIYTNKIELTIKAKQFYLFSEIQTNLELFEAIPTIHFVLYTSTQTILGSKMVGGAVATEISGLPQQRLQLHTAGLIPATFASDGGKAAAVQTALLWTSIFTKPF